MKDPDALRNYARNLVQLKKIHGGELSGPCPICGGNDRFSVFADGTGWICRKCPPADGASVATGGYYDLIARYERISVRDAMQKYGDQVPRVHAPPRAPEKAVAVGEFKWLDETWQLKARGYVAECEARLAGSEGVQYLEKRGISYSTAQAWRFGYDPAYPIAWEGKECTRRGPALIMPWLAVDGKMVTAVKARLIHETDKTTKARNRRGGDQMLIGAHLLDRKPICVAVEGEINAASIWQAFHDQADVLSFGHEGNFKHVGSLLSRFDQILIWLDDASFVQKCQAWMSSQHGAASLRCRYTQSPGNMDANDILVGYGGDHLHALLKKLLCL